MKLDEGDKIASLVWVRNLESRMIEHLFIKEVDTDEGYMIAYKDSRFEETYRVEGRYRVEWNPHCFEGGHYGTPDYAPDGGPNRFKLKGKDPNA